MSDYPNTAPILDERQIAAELDLSSLLTSLADEQLITGILTKIARRSVIADINRSITKAALSVGGTTYPYQFTLEFPSGSPLLLVEVAAESLTSSNAIVVALNGQVFGGTTANFYARPYIWVPPSTQVDVFATGSGVVAHATGLQLAL